MNIPNDDIYPVSLLMTSAYRELLLLCMGMTMT